MVTTFLIGVIGFGIAFLLLFGAPLCVSSRARRDPCGRTGEKHYRRRDQGRR